MSRGGWPTSQPTTNDGCPRSGFSDLGNLRTRSWGVYTGLPFPAGMRKPMVWLSGRSAHDVNSETSNDERVPINPIESMDGCWIGNNILDRLLTKVGVLIYEPNRV